MYDIEIDYTTGDSFNSERKTEESLGIVTSDMEMAKKNLKRIKAHYVKHDGAWDYPTLTLLTDGGERTISPFWMGYFETLHGARIVELEDEELSFSL